MEIPVFQTSLMPIVDVVGSERAGFESWRAGDGEAAVTAFAEAASTWAQRSFPRFSARCALAAGELARRHGDTDAAHRHLCTAADVATRFQMAPTLAMTRAALGALERDHHRARLSPREVEVLELVAAGRTASQIAGALGVGESTVVTHVNSARTKLGARTRMQAATMITGRSS
jgi:DNA-binding CsgD family transcriptional regulator